MGDDGVQASTGGDTVRVPAWQIARPTSSGRGWAT